MLNPVPRENVFSYVFNKWFYNGCPKEKLFLCRADINSHNSFVLSLLSVVTAVLMVFLSFYDRDDVSGHYIFFVIVQMAVFFYGLALVLKNVQLRFMHLAGIAAFATNIVIFSLYVCVFQRDTYVLRFLIFFLSFEAIFILSAPINIMFNAAVFAAFYVTYNNSMFFFGVNMPWESRFDIANVGMACIMTSIMTWYNSHVFMSRILTSLSLREERNRFQEESIKDQLTGLNNRRSFEQSISFYISICQHVNQTVCVIMMDMDFFKNYNDYYGHQSGDIVLKSVGNILLRLTDEERVYAARVGGEEFIVMWVEKRIAEAERVALKLRQMIIDMKIPHEKSLAAEYVTASMGVYIMRGGSKNTAAEMYSAVDSALYKAKRSSRNCIVRLDSADNSYTPVEVRDHNSIITR